MVEAGGWRWSGRKKARANQGPDPLTGSACQACFGRLRAGGETHLAPERLLSLSRASAVLPLLARFICMPRYQYTTDTPLPDQSPSRFATLFNGPTLAWTSICGSTRATHPAVLRPISGS